MIDYLRILEDRTYYADPLISLVKVELRVVTLQCVPIRFPTGGCFQSALAGTDGR